MFDYIYHNYLIWIIMLVNDKRLILASCFCIFCICHPEGIRTCWRCFQYCQPGEQRRCHWRWIQVATASPGAEGKLSHPYPVYRFVYFSHVCFSAERLARLQGSEPHLPKKISAHEADCHPGIHFLTGGGGCRPNFCQSCWGTMEPLKCLKRRLRGPVWNGEASLFGALERSA